MKHLNGLTKAFEEIRALNKSAKGGNIFDETVQQILVQNLDKRCRFITNVEWKRYYQKYRQQTLSGIYDFSDLELPDNIQDDLLIVDKPNGSQKTPDLLVIINKRGLCIEIKSSNTCDIIWNSGLPKAGFIYIFNAYVDGKTTFFMGEDIVSEDEARILENLNRHLKEIVKSPNVELKALASRWKFYPRAMYQNNELHFKDPALTAQREANVLVHLKNFLKNKGR